MPANTRDATATAIYRRLLTYAQGDWPVFTAAFVGMAIYAATDATFAALLKPLLDKSFIEHDEEFTRFIPVVILGLITIRGFAALTQDYCMNWIGRHVIKKLRREVFDHYLIMPAGVYDRSSSGVLLSKLTYNIEQVAVATTQAVQVLIKDSLTIIALVSWMFYLNAQFAALVIVLGPIIGIMIQVVSRIFRRYGARIQNSMGDLTRVSEEVIAGHRVVKVFNAQDFERRHFEEVNEKNRRLHMRMVLTRAAGTPVVQLLAAGAIAGIIYMATRSAEADEVSVGTFVSFVGAMVFAMSPLKRITNINQPLQQGIAAGKSIFDMIDGPREPGGGSLALEQARGDVEFKGVGFAYDSAKGAVLTNISMVVPAGEKLAIVGKSGSGKSTLVSLLPRFYDPDTGMILIDGCDITEYPLHDLRNQISLVSQDIVLFNDTIANNIAYGALEDSTRADIEGAARVAHVLEFAKKLPDGLDALVGDRGILLSGGQRQRIAIARAVLKNSPILILDEATSALDTESERHIQNALDDLMRDRTTFIIAHRLSTVENADKILVLDQGRVIEFGRHEDLLQVDGHYASLYRMQFNV